MLPGSIRGAQSLGFLLLVLKHCMSTRVAHNYGPLGHLATSRDLWSKLLRPQDIVVDATCGNGHDAAFLAPLCGKLYCIDVQREAIQNTRQRLLDIPLLNTHVDSSIHLIHGSHERFPACITPSSVALICFNLGYLPGIQAADAANNKHKSEVPVGAVTKAETTLLSLNNALPLIREGGMLSVTAYPGHTGGAEETSCVHNFMSTLDDHVWRVYANMPLNRPKAPVLFNAFKIDKRGPQMS